MIKKLSLVFLFLLLSFSVFAKNLMPIWYIPTSDAASYNGDGKIHAVTQQKNNDVEYFVEIGTYTKYSTNY